MYEPRLGQIEKIRGKCMNHDWGRLKRLEGSVWTTIGAD